MRGTDAVLAAAAHLRAGKLVVITGERRGIVEGHLALAATRATAEGVNFMATHGRGVIAVGLTPERCEELNLHALTASTDNLYGPSVRVSVEAREGVSTGISAADRARTISVAGDPASHADDLVQPGHVFPLRAAAGGVLERAGRAEAGTDLARLAGLEPACALCEILAADGSLASLGDLEALARQHDLVLVRVEDIVAHRLISETRIERQSSRSWQTEEGSFVAIDYRDSSDDLHVVLLQGDASRLTRQDIVVHRSCPAGELLASSACECTSRRNGALRSVAERGGAVVLLGLRRQADPTVCGAREPEADRRLAFGERPNIPAEIIVEHIVADLVGATSDP